MAETTYDVAVIGGGPGGYAAAITAAQAGKRTVCVESRDVLGGTCLNVGCIPSKTLLHWSQRYYEAGHDYADHGISVSGLGLDLGAMMADKEKVVASFTSGIDYLFKKNKVDRLVGNGRLTTGNTVTVANDASPPVEVTAENIIIATGSIPATLADLAVDEERIVSSTGALALSEVPETMIVVGGGYIGLELGSVWQRLGARVTVVEFLDRLAPTMDFELARQYQRSLARQGLAFKLGTKVTGAEVAGDGVSLNLEPAAGGETEEATADVVLVAVGRQAFTGGLGLADVGVALDERGCVMVDERLRTNVPNVYAIGDVIPGPMLAHKATAEAIAVVETISGRHGAVNYEAIPAVIYTDPEVAWVGKTEEELVATEVAYKSGSFPFAANSRAKTIGHTQGLAKVLTDAETDRVLGVHIMCSEAGALIGEAVLAMEFGGSAEDVARTCHAHPTLSEALMEAASLAAFGKAIHI